MTMQERLNRQAENYLATLRQAIQTNWRLACEYEGIPVDCKFAIFSDDNPHLKMRSQLHILYWENLAAYRAGGYVGLHMQNGKARSV
jgi:hypothetical protein